MESNLREISSVKRELDLTLGQEDLAPYIDKGLRQVQSKVNMKGFRPGKTPVELIRKLHGASIESDAVEEAVQEEFSKLMTDNASRPIGSPVITKMDRDEAGALNVTIAYEVLPPVELGSYKGLAAKRAFHKTSDHDIDHELEHIRERYMTTEPAETAENAGHIVTIDLQKLGENDEPVEGAVSEGVKVYLAGHGVNAELKEALLNSKVGDTFRIELPTGENESNIPYQVVVKDIQRAVLPELDDKLAAEVLGEPDATIDRLREAIRHGIEEDYNSRYRRNLRDELIGQLVANHPFEVPESLVREALRSFVEDLRTGPEKKLPEGFDAAKFEQEMWPTAERTVRWALLRDMIIQKEDLKPEETDFEGLAEREAQRTGIDYDKLLAYFKRSPEISERIVSEKAAQMIEDYAIIEEVEDRQLYGTAVDDHAH